MSFVWMLVVAGLHAAPLPDPAQTADALDKLFDGRASSSAAVPVARPNSKRGKSGAALSNEDLKFLDDLSKRNFRFFREKTDPKTGLVLDRAPFDGSDKKGEKVASIASTGFGLSGLCVAVERGWLSKKQAAAQAKKTLEFLSNAPQEHGWFYHFMDSGTGKRAWSSEVSSIDTALLLAGVLTARQCLDDPDVKKLATKLYERVDFPWMLNGSPNLLSMGWTPEKGFIDARWDTYSEHMILDLLAIGSPTHPIPPSEWDAWARPEVLAGGRKYIAGVSPLFIHQYSQAFIDFRGLCDRHGIDYFQNSVDATMAQRAFMSALGKNPSGKYSDYSDEMWGLTASDSCDGSYQAWGAPPMEGPIDGSVVPSAPGGSLMFTPRESIDALKAMKKKMPKAYGRYGFSDALNPKTGCVTKDSLGIDQGITLLSEANLRGGEVWTQFMKNPEITNAMSSVGFKPCSRSAQ